MDNLPLTEIVNLGTNGLTLMLVWQLIKMNEKLLNEIRGHNNLLIDIINRLMGERGERGMTRRDDFDKNIN